VKIAFKLGRFWAERREKGAVAPQSSRVNEPKFTQSRIDAAPFPNPIQQPRFFTRFILKPPYLDAIHACPL
jgi:hypothetical protein